jgi:ATP-dependent DNA helicase PIF1
VNCDGAEADGRFTVNYLPDSVTFSRSLADMLNLPFDEMKPRFQRFPQKLGTSMQFRQLANATITTTVYAAYHNDRVNDWNAQMVDRVSMALDQEVVSLYGQEMAEDGSGHSFVTDEYMQSYTDRHVPNHELRLFVGCLVVLLRNFLTTKGMCNGSRYLVMEISRHCLILYCIDDAHFGEIVNLPRIKFCITDKSLEFSRLQFPVAVAYGLTVHRLQGYTVPLSGYLIVDMRFGSFCHAQCYVAISRAQQGSQLHVLIADDAPDRTFEALVYRQLLAS